MTTPGMHGESLWLEIGSSKLSELGMLFADLLLTLH